MARETITIFSCSSCSLVRLFSHMLIYDLTATRTRWGAGTATGTKHSSTRTKKKRRGDIPFSLILLSFLRSHDIMMVRTARRRTHRYRPPRLRRESSPHRHLSRLDFSFHLRLGVHHRVAVLLLSCFCLASSSPSSRRKSRWDTLPRPPSAPPRASSSRRPPYERDGSPSRLPGRAASGGRGLYITTTFHNAPRGRKRRARRGSESHIASPPSPGDAAGVPPSTMGEGREAAHLRTVRCCFLQRVWESERFGVLYIRVCGISGSGHPTRSLLYIGFAGRGAEFNGSVCCMGNRGREGGDGRGVGAGNGIRIRHGLTR